MKAVIPAAGLGTRFLPITKAQPKEMLPVGDKPAIQYVVEEAVAAGFDDILLITGRGKRAIEDHFDVANELEQLLKDKKDFEALDEIKMISNMADIHYIRQKVQAGLGDAILCAKKHVGDDFFAVLLGDTITLNDRQNDVKPCIQELYEAYQVYGCSIIGIEEVPKEKVQNYGIISGKLIGEGLYDITELIEKPTPDKAPSNLAIFGRYILTPDIFEFLDKTDKGFGGELQLTDALQNMLSRERIIAKVIKSKRFDIGNKRDWLLASLEVSLASSQFDGLEESIISILKSRGIKI